MPLEVIRRAPKGAVQARDRWHLRHGLAEAAGHCSCWVPKDGRHAGTTAERGRHSHNLLDKGNRPA